MIVKGYCADIPFLKSGAQEPAIVASGVRASQVYVDGRHDETFDACVTAFRSRGGELRIFGSYRVLGASRSAIMDRVAALRKIGVVIFDVRSGKRSDAAGDEMLAEALVLIHGARKMRDDPKFARRIGSAGGKSKGVRAAMKRATIADDKLLRRIVTAEFLTWEQREWLLDDRISEATLRRRYIGNQ